MRFDILQAYVCKRFLFLNCSKHSKIAQTSDPQALISLITKTI